VLGGLRPGSLAALDGMAFVAQDTPVYKNLSAADMLHLTRTLNRRLTSATRRPGWPSWASRCTGRPGSCPVASGRSSR
jgi:hypothetical protein